MTTHSQKHRMQRLKNDQRPQWFKFVDSFRDMYLLLGLPLLTQLPVARSQIVRKLTSLPLIALPSSDNYWFFYQRSVVTVSPATLSGKKRLVAPVVTLCLVHLTLAVKSRSFFPFFQRNDYATEQCEELDSLLPRTEEWSLGGRPSCSTTPTRTQTHSQACSQAHTHTHTHCWLQMFHQGDWPESNTKIRGMRTHRGCVWPGEQWGLSNSSARFHWKHGTWGRAYFSHIFCLF